MKTLLNMVVFGCLLSALIPISGCGASSAVEPKPKAKVLALRNQLLLTEEPAEAVGVLEAKQALQKKKDNNESAELTVIGRISAGEQTPWDEKQAVFLISDAAAGLVSGEDEHFHDGEGHDPNTCPFCNRHKSLADALAIIKCVDAGGKVIPIDARKLLGLAENQLVVVQGRGGVDGLGNLVISADGIYVRQ